MTVVRFAPSPTGHLHVGNIRPALFNWLFARKTGGSFVLRFDDTDAERSKEDYVDQIKVDLAWLGLTYDRLERQSTRFDRYQAVSDALKERGLLYPCYETPDELDRKRARRRARGLPPIYDRSALTLTAAEKASLESEGRKPHWRFLLPNFKTNPAETERTEVTFEDLIRGHQVIDLASVSDPVLIRADGTYLYTLPSVIDDIDFGITHVIRGDDHVTNAGVQVAIFEALEGAVPLFGHHNLLTLPGGEGLSKRLGSLSVMSLRDDGMEAGAVAAAASLLGTSLPVRPVAKAADLVADFDLKAVSQSAATFDPAELANLSVKVLHQYAFTDVADRLTTLDIDCDEALWLTVRGNLERLDDLRFWQTLVTGDLEETPDLSDDDWAFVKAAVAHLPVGDFDGATWSTWTSALKTATGRKGKQLFMPLRVALTGQKQGPDLGQLLPLIGREKTLARLA